MLRKKATSAISWAAIDQIVRQGLNLAISVAMARLVAPEAYGTVALLSLFTGIAGVFVDGGLSSALIQKKDATHADESTVFWFNLAAGLLMGLALFLCAPLISGFYKIGILLPVTQIYAFQFFLGACNSVQNTLFAKHLDFKTPLKINFIATLFSAFVGILLAWNGHGVWALVAQFTVGGVLQTTLIWKFSQWRPAFIFSSDSFRILFRFGGGMFLSSLLDAVYRQFYSLIIGKWYGVHDLGIYNRAETTKQLPTGALTGILSSVAFPIFSQTSDDPERLRRGLRMSIRGIMFLNIPMMIGLVVVADPLIFTLYGPVWAPAVSLLQILALGGLLWPLHVLNLSVLKAMGRSGLLLRIEVIKKAVGLSLVVMGARYGMHGMAWAIVISSVFAFVFNAYYTHKLLNYGAWRQSCDCAPALACGALMGAVVMGCAHAMHFPPPLQLVLLSLGGALAYSFVSKVFRIQELDDILQFARSTTRAN